MSEMTEVRASAETPAPERPSKWRMLRDRGQWSVVVVLPLTLAVATMAVEDLRDAVKGLFATPVSAPAPAPAPEPPGLAVTAVGELGGCSNTYYPMSREVLRRADRRSLSGAEPLPPGVAVVRRAGDTIQEDPVLGVTLQAPSATAIVVTGVTAELMSSRPLPTSGTLREPFGCGAAMAQRAFDVRLDGRGSTVRAAEGSADFPFKVAGADPEYLEFQVRTELPREVRFRLRVSWVTQGEARESVLDDGGKGYRLMGPNRLPSFRPGGN
ncbi:hypothetical protein [Streptomyces sp. S.PB5]|uniref:hypothetical protein n=1 Tax=Streptomyces sp. S.PB5 TaxID=3020844 RepID=UPI0025B0FA8D|nr:hypothetical protein [Streptomyces sp. S.PB5]MDN3022634.1 hypothetical protein [Streptomyces sp. S.PB5]